MVISRHILALGISFAVFFIVLISPASARPYQGEEEIFTQPDGTKLPLVLYGDEFFIRAQTQDGYTVIRDKKTGWICYAENSDQNDSLISTGIPVVQGKAAHTGPGLLKKRVTLTDNARKDRIKKSRTRLFGDQIPADALAKSTLVSTDSLPPRKNPENFTGVCKGLCVVVDFPDAPITANFPTADSAIRFLDKKFNSLEPKDKSLRYYFKVWSGGKFDVQFIVEGVYRAPNTFAYYDALPYAQGHGELLLSACKTLDAEGFSFSQLTKKLNSKSIRGLCIANTGNPAAWAEGMWNHSGELNSSFSVDSVRLRSYCTCAATGGALYHEMGHLIADWPDLYSSNDVETGCWDIMGSSSSSLLANPYLLYQNGWNDVENIANLPSGTLVAASGKNPNTGHVYYRNTKPNEFFYFKPYTKQMPLCSGIPDQGLTIWRINTKGDNFDYPDKPLLVEMVHANNSISNIKTNVCFKASGRNAYSSNTTPAANWLDKTPSGIDINEISTADTAMTFRQGAAVGNQVAELGTKTEKSVMKLSEVNGRPVLFLSREALTSAGRLVVCTSAGKCVFRKNLIPGYDDVSDLSFLSAGLYVAYLRGQGIKGTKTIVIQ